MLGPGDDVGRGTPEIAGEVPACGGVEEGMVPVNTKKKSARHCAHSQYNYLEALLACQGRFWVEAEEAAAALVALLPSYPQQCFH